MPSRRPHLKSRHGCIPCKRARVKCDQVHPICSKCARFGRPCEYLLLSSDDQSVRLANPALQSSNESVIGQSTSPEQPASHQLDSDTTFDDLGLMHLYTVATCITLEPNPQLREIWQVFAPQEATSHPYLMHSLLAMAALHQISLGTDQYERYLALAVKHHTLALAGSKPELEHVTERNCHALFTFSAMIAVSALALPVCRNRTSLRDPIGEIAQAAILMRGSSTIVQTSRQWLEAGKLGPLLCQAFLSKMETLPKEVDIVFNNLETQVESVEISNKTLVACQSALERLRNCFRIMQFKPENNKLSVLPVDRGVIWSWLATVDVDFITLLSGNDPMALVILAHYAVLLHALDEVWWCRGWGSALIKSISQSVGDDWQQGLSWPTRQI